MEKDKQVLSFLIFFVLIVSMYIILDTRITSLENENILLRDTLNEQNGVIWLNQASQFDMKE